MSRTPDRRHVWVTYATLGVQPGLLLSWQRHATTREWRAMVAVVTRGSVLIEWVSAAEVRPVGDGTPPTAQEFES